MLTRVVYVGVGIDIGVVIDAGVGIDTGVMLMYELLFVVTGGGEWRPRWELTGELMGLM